MSQAIKERPIIFSAESVRAIIDGRKTQTRRVMKPPKGASLINVESDPCPCGVAGDRLWVRETTWIDSKPCSSFGGRSELCLRCFRDDGTMAFETGEQGFSTGREPWTEWTPDLRREDYNLNRSLKFISPIHMPRWASRLTLEVVSVRVERLQEITPGDILAEAVIPKMLPYEHAIDEWRRTWDIINSKRGYPWASNPWVWVIEFHQLSASAPPRDAGSEKA